MEIGSNCGIQFEDFKYLPFILLCSSIRYINAIFRWYPKIIFTKSFYNPRAISLNLKLYEHTPDYSPVFIGLVCFVLFFFLLFFYIFSPGSPLLCFDFIFLYTFIQNKNSTVVISYLSSDTLC